MSSFYKSKLRMARFISRNFLQFFSCVVIGLLMLLVSIGFRSYLPTKIVVIGGVIGSLLIAVFFFEAVVLSIYQYHIHAIDEALKLKVLLPKYAIRLSSLITLTELEQSPARLRKWLDNRKKLLSTTKERQILEEKKQRIERGITLKEVKVEIKITEQKIEEIKSLLA